MLLRVGHPPGGRPAARRSCGSATARPLPLARPRCPGSRAGWPGSVRWNGPFRATETGAPIPRAPALSDDTLAVLSSLLSPARAGADSTAQRPAPGYRVLTGPDRSALAHPLSRAPIPDRTRGGVPGLGPPAARSHRRGARPPAPGSWSALRDARRCLPLDAPLVAVPLAVLCRTLAGEIHPSRAPFRSARQGRPVGVRSFDSNRSPSRATTGFITPGQRRVACRERRWPRRGRPAGQGKPVGRETPNRRPTNHRGGRRVERRRRSSLLLSRFSRASHRRAPRRSSRTRGARPPLPALTRPDGTRPPALVPTGS